jgi:DNA replicative helicase MCM subunit Mcm2 (Cdc46/Mcm family)
MDIDIIMTGKSRNQNDRMQIILGTVRDLEKKVDVVEENELIKILSTKVEVSETEARALIQQMLKEGLLYQPKPGHVKRTTV